MTTPTITLGMRLQIARRTAGLSGKDVARTLGLTTTTISRYENDSTPVPAAILYAYQDLCNVPIEWLRGEIPLSQEPADRRSSGGGSLPRLRMTG